MLSWAWWLLIAVTLRVMLELDACISWCFHLGSLFDMNVTCWCTAFGMWSWESYYDISQINAFVTNRILAWVMANDNVMFKSFVKYALFILLNIELRTGYSGHRSGDHSSHCSGEHGGHFAAGHSGHKSGDHVSHHADGHTGHLAGIMVTSHWTLWSQIGGSQ